MNNGKILSRRNQYLLKCKKITKTFKEKSLIDFKKFNFNNIVKIRNSNKVSII